jgi:hypothetical protein
MKPEDALPSSQQLTIGPYPKPGVCEDILGGK